MSEEDGNTADEQGNKSNGSSPMSNAHMVECRCEVAEAELGTARAGTETDSAIKDPKNK